MKEAAGEANMTVITIVLIAIVLAVGTLLVGNMMKGTKNKANCNNAGGVWQNSHCYAASACTVADNGATTCSGTLISY